MRAKRKEHQLTLLKPPKRRGVQVASFGTQTIYIHRGGRLKTKYRLGLHDLQPGERQLKLKLEFIG